jgi:type 1 fimbria pilin
MMKSHLTRLLQALALLTAGAAAMIATPALAQDSPGPNQCLMGGSIFDSPVDFGTVALPRDLTTSLEGRDYSPHIYRTLTYNCGPGTSGIAAMGYSLVTIGLAPPIYGRYLATGVDGVGVYITITRPDGSVFSVSSGVATSPTGLRNGVFIPATGTGGWQTATVEYALEIDQNPARSTTPDQPSTGKWVAPPPFSAGIAYFFDSTSFLVSARNSVASSGNFTAPTCSATSPTVTLPDVTTAALMPSGNFTPAKDLPDIVLTCPQMGYPMATIDMSSRLLITYTDANDPTNVGNMLTLQRIDGSASGVKVQILSDTTPVSFGPASSDEGTIHQTPVPLGGNVLLAKGGAATPVTSLHIPLKARYISDYDGTTTFLKPGKVKAAATFTLSYQ